MAFVFPSPNGEKFNTVMHAAHLAFRRYLLYGALSLIILISTLTNLHWIRNNIVLVGHDASSYLTRAMAYREIIPAFSLQAIFQALTFPEYRAPALYIAAQPFMWLWGFDMDGAQYLNVTLFAVVILLTFLLGATVADQRVGLFSALMVSLLPMMTAMSRLFYTEMFLTAAVVTNLIALHKSDRFGHRSWSLLWGASLGMGLLVKWTMPIYLWLPLLWTLWRMRIDFPRSGFAGWRWTHILLAITLAFVLATLWYWPNRALAEQFPLGGYLWPSWILLLVPFFYGLMHPSSRPANLVAASFLALAIASLWYLPRSDIGFRLLVEDQERSYAGASMLNPDNYLRNFRYLYYSHFGALAFWLIVPASLWPWLNAWWRRQTLNPAATLLWLSIASALVVLSLILQQNQRNLVPLLPSIAVVIAIGLHTYPRRIAATLGIVWTIVLLMQWAVYTFDGMAQFHERTTTLWVQDEYSVRPATGSTDPAYWIGPDVLATVGDPDGDAESIGVLIDTWEIHRGKLRYLAALNGQNVTIAALTEDSGSDWGQVFVNRWILLKDGDNSSVGQPGREILARIAEGDALFHQLYALLRVYNLPNGDTATLYERDGPRQPRQYPVILIETSPVADVLNHLWSPHATLVFGDREIAVWTAVHDLAADRVLMPERADGEFLESLAGLTDTILVVSRYNLDARNAVANDGYFAYTIASGDTTLDVFGRPTRPLQPLSVVSPWEEIEITTLRSYEVASPGEVLPVELELENHSAESLKLSVRLIDSDGNVIAQNDVIVEPTVSLGLLIPPDAPAGKYAVGAVLYEPETMREAVSLSGEQLGLLAQVLVSE